MASGLYLLVILFWKIGVFKAESVKFLEKQINSKISAAFSKKAHKHYSKIIFLNLFRTIETFDHIKLEK